MLNTIFNIDCKQGLKNLPDQSVNCIVTSPPYYGLRDYQTATWIGGSNECDHQTPDNDLKNAGEKQKTSKGTVRYEKSVCRKCGAVRKDQQIGLEETPEAYVQNLVEVFREARRVLRDDGTLWLNIGDSYASDYKGSGGQSTKQDSNKGSRYNSTKFNHGVKPKDLIGIPWMVAFALRADGWYLRQDIIWHKPNPMPESVTDRCTKSHEYIFLLSKSARYYYDADAIKEPMTSSSLSRLNQNVEDQKGSDRIPGKTNGTMKAVAHKSAITPGQTPQGKALKRMNGYADLIYEKVNKRSVWTVTTKPFKESHFATFPEDLIAPCILAGCPEGGIVLDCFMGAGTTALVSRKLNRNYIGFELNPDYIKIAEKRIFTQIGIFA